MKLLREKRHKTHVNYQTEIWGFNSVMHMETGNLGSRFWEEFLPLDFSSKKEGWFRNSHFPKQSLWADTKDHRMSEEGNIHMKHKHTHTHTHTGV